MTLQYGGVFEQGNIRYLLSSANVEDNFNTWTFQWYKILRDPILTSDLPGGLRSPPYYDFFTDDRNDTIHIAWEDNNNFNRYGIFSCANFINLLVTPATHTEYEPSGVPYATIKEGWHLGNAEELGASRSIQSYTLIVSFCGTTNYDTINLNVYRNNSLLWHHSVRDDLPAPQNSDAEIKYIEMSPSGKYLTIITQNYTGGWYTNILLYKGSYVES